jgi:hypothetical protein
MSGHDPREDAVAIAGSAQDSERVDRAYLGGAVCLAGGAVQVVYGLLAIPFPYAESSYGWDEILWAVANVGMISGVLGLLALDVARPRAVARLGGALAVLGNVARIAVSALLVARPTGDYVPPILVSILLVVVGMGIVGVTTLLGRRLRGWHAWIPLLAAGFTLIPASTYSISLFVHFILLGLWGIPWMLVGYVVLTLAADRRRDARSTGAILQGERWAG